MLSQLQTQNEKKQHFGNKNTFAVKGKETGLEKYRFPSALGIYERHISLARRNSQSISFFHKNSLEASELGGQESVEFISSKSVRISREENLVGSGQRRRAEN